MEHLGVLKNSLKRVREFQIELDFEGVAWFLRRGENRSTRRKTSRSKGAPSSLPR